MKHNAGYWCVSFGSTDKLAAQVASVRPRFSVAYGRTENPRAALREMVEKDNSRRGRFKLLTAPLLGHLSLVPSLTMPTNTVQSFCASLWPNLRHPQGARNLESENR